MLPLKNRLKNREDFFAISRRGAFFSAGAVSIKFLSSSKEWPRIGFSVGLKFSKKAVERNRIKRKLRSAVAQNLSHFKKGVDVVVMVKKIPSKIPQAILARDLENVFQKGKLIN